MGLAWYSMEGSWRELRQIAHVSVQMLQLHTATAFHFCERAQARLEGRAAGGRARCAGGGVAETARPGGCPVASHLHLEPLLLLLSVRGGTRLGRGGGVNSHSLRSLVISHLCSPPLSCAARVAGGRRRAHGRPRPFTGCSNRKSRARVRTRFPSFRATALCGALRPSSPSVPMKKPWLPAGTAPALLETERCRLRCVPWACSLRRPDQTPGRSSSLTSSKTGTQSCPREARYSSASGRTWTGPQLTSPYNKVCAPLPRRHCAATVTLPLHFSAAAVLLLCRCCLRLSQPSDCAAGELTPPRRRAAPPLLAALPPPLLTRLCRHG